MSAPRIQATSRTLVQNADFIMRDHRVHGRRIMPGVTFLDLIYRLLERKGLASPGIELANILFAQVFSTSEQWDRRLWLKVEGDSEGGKVTATSERIVAGQPAAAERELHFSCDYRVMAEPDPSARQIPLTELMQGAVSVLDMDEVYALARKGDIQHGPFMKGLGRIFQGSDYLLAEMRLGQLASQYLEQFLLHPALLDCATAIPFLVHFARVENPRPMIPIHIESFRLYRRLEVPCYVLVRFARTQAPSEDLMFADLELFDGQGRLAAKFRKLSFKTIRLQNLLDTPEAGSVVATSKGNGHHRPAAEPGSAVRALRAEEHLESPGDRGSDRNLVPVLVEPRLDPANRLAAAVRQIQSMIARRVGRPAAEIEARTNFYDLGLDSKDLLEIVAELELAYSRSFYPTLLFEYNNVQGLAGYLAQEMEVPTESLDLASSEASRSASGPAEDGCVWLAPTWRESPLEDSDPSAPGLTEWLVVYLGDADSADPGLPFSAGKEPAGARVTRVFRGERYRYLGAGAYSVGMTDPADATRLVQALIRQGRLPQVALVLHPRQAFEPELGGLQAQIQAGLLPMLSLVQALLGQRGEASMTVLNVLASGAPGIHPLHEAVAAWSRTVAVESGGARLKAVTLDHLVLPASWQELIELEVRPGALAAGHVAYRGGKRWVRELRPAPMERGAKSTELLRKGGTYLITGGLGGVGLEVAEHLMRQWQATCVLIGRSALNDAQRERLARLEGLGGRALYCPCDVSQPDSLQRFWDWKQAQGLTIQGVFHAAGVTRDALWLNKTEEEWREVMAPKVLGTVALDARLAGEPLDFFLLFSSTSAAKGNPGQSDYALANAFLDHYAEWREEARRAGARRGRTLSINWPMWQDGGMRLDAEMQARLAEFCGMKPLDAALANGLWTEALRQEAPVLMPLYGNVETLQRFFEVRGLLPALEPDRFRLRAEPLASSQAASAAPVADQPAGPAEGVGDVSEHLAQLVAVIGLSGRYPQARDLEEFWDNLAAGRNCVTEVTPGRWAALGGGPAASAAGAGRTRWWGGFLDDIDQFDALLFHIAPKDAARMDPEERLMLQVVWETLEDAGLTREALERQQTAAGKGIGVFVGCMYRQYHLLAGDADARGILSTFSNSGLANRISYFFNFKGPSLCLDSACSSSLTAIHLACESLRRGECVVALAGGVNLSLLPQKFVALDQAGLLGSGPLSRSLGDGDGFVPGEGVGAVLLKPLAAALADGDRIYGVIRGSHVNHGGATSGFSVPSSVAEADLIRQALRQAQTPPETITCVEVAANGSSLGDAIEVAALTRVFPALRKGQPPYCVLGSVKPNIGHLEAASGISQLTKVLLQLERRQLPPLLNAETLNPNVKLAGTPFYLLPQLTEWKAIESASDPAGLPRRAAISSFGAGGSNAHLVVEEFRPQSVPADPPRSGPCLVLISARDPGRLEAFVRRYREFLERALAKPAAERPRLGDVALTSQIGREPMRERLAIVASSLEELSETCAAILRAPAKSPANVFQGTAKANPDGTAELEARAASSSPSSPCEGRAGRGLRRGEASENEPPHPIPLLHPMEARESSRSLMQPWLDAEVQQRLPEWLAHEDLPRLADLWIRGYPVDWARLPSHRSSRRIRVPFYPFEPRRHWLAAQTQVLPSDPSARVDTPPERVPVSRPTEPAPSQELQGSVRRTVVGIMAELLDVRVEDIHADENLSDYGFDSVSITEFATRIHQAYEVALKPPQFFEFSSIDGLVDYLVERHPAEMRRHHGLDDPAAVPPTSLQSPEPVREVQIPARTAGSLSSRPVDEVSSGRRFGEPVAIVGMAGILPQSADLEEFWEHLQAGRHLVTEIPSSRWDWRTYWGDPAREPGKSNSKWGGFIPGVELFDAAFFGISAREARLMDPQQRLFLQTVWKCLEDAGYRASALKGSRTGVFVGVSSFDYRERVKASQAAAEAYSATGSAMCMMANRVSYLLDWHGPSEAIDTACSSSLVAVHRAVEAIQAGDCDQAMAGGANILLNPEIFVAFSQAGMLSPEGKCKTFDHRADGYVRGEGVGVVFLKPLRQAERDGDTIHGVILASSVNHGGRVNSLTTPNPNLQAELLVQAYTKAGVPAETIGYLEAHGTGTALGDPVEVNGVKKAFEQLYAQAGRSFSGAPHCGLGSLKSNLGHLESAAGIAGLLKVLLALRYQQLPATLHVESVNPYIDLSGSPLFLVDRLRPWARLSDATGRACPRRAGVSSFGFGGTNAHVVVEEYPVAGGRTDAEEGGEQVFVLSARSADRLAAYAREFVRFLERWGSASEGEGMAVRLLDVAFTSQVGREPMDERLAVVARNVPELIDRLRAFVDGEDSHWTHGVSMVGRGSDEPAVRSQEGLAEPEYSQDGSRGRSPHHAGLGEGSLDDGSRGRSPHHAGLGEGSLDDGSRGRSPHHTGLGEGSLDDGSRGRSPHRTVSGTTEHGLFRGSAKQAPEATRKLLEGREGQAFLGILVEDRKLSKLAALWVQGAEVDWTALHAPGALRRVSLPTYPFEPERHWVEEPAASAARSPEQGTLSSTRTGEAASAGRVFKKRFQRADSVLADHVVHGQHVLPGVVSLELALQAVRQVEPDQAVTLHDVVFESPLVVELECVDVLVRLTPRESGCDFEILTQPDPAQPEQVHARGRAEFGAAPSAETASDPVEAAMARCATRVQPVELYGRFEAVGLHYGRTFQGIEKLCVGPEEVIGELQRPAEGVADAGAWLIPPGWLDSALQCIAGFALEASVPMMPFAVESFRQCRPVPERAFARVRRAGANSFDVVIVDEADRLCVRIDRLLMRPAANAASLRTFLFRWVETPLSSAAAAVPLGTGHALIVTHAAEEKSAASWVGAWPEPACRINLGPGPSRQNGDLAWDVDVADGDRLEQAVDACPRITSICFLGSFDLRNVDAPEDHEPRSPVTPVFLPARRADWKVGDTASQFMGRGGGDEIARGLASLESSLAESAWVLFRILKRLLQAGRLAECGVLKVVTRGLFEVHPEDRIKPGLGVLQGLATALIHEFPGLGVSTIDLERAPAGPGAWEAEARAVWAEPPQTTPMPVAIRGGLRFQRQPFEVELPKVERPVFRRGGVYLIIGGAGGIGAALAGLLCRRFEARVALLGRRPLDDSIQATLAACAGAGGEACYVQADAADSVAMREAVAAVKARWGALHGVLHSALVLEDRLLDRMDEAAFRRVLRPKVEGGLVPAEVLAAEPLDFMVFFSSAVSLLGSAGQSNYIAACAFEDALAHALRQRVAFPVKVINWGYWGSVGVVSGARYQDRLRARGVGSIEPEEGMALLEALLASSVDQVLPFKAQPALLTRMGLSDRRRMRVLTSGRPSGLESAATSFQVPAGPPESVLQPFAAVLTELNAGLAAHLGGLLFGGSGEAGRGRVWDRRDLLTRWKVVESYHRLLDALLDLLAQEGWVRVRREREGSVQVELLRAPTGVGMAWGAWCDGFAARHPLSRPFVELVRPCLEALPRVLDGSVNPVDVLFAGGSFARVEAVYRGNPLADYYHELVAGLVAAWVRERVRPGAPVQVLEVGAGTGATTRFVLEALRPYQDRIVYHFTDISPAFTEKARQVLGATYPFVRFQKLDIEQPCTAQGWEPHSIDLVLGSNVFHATRAMAGTLEHVKKLLKPGGVLVVDEVVRLQPFATLTFGLMPGWWLFEDGRRRIPGSPLLEVSQWRWLLQEAGFVGVREFGLGARGHEAWGQAVLISESNGQVRVSSSAPVHGATEPTAKPTPRLASSSSTETPVNAACDPDASPVAVGEREAVAVVRGVFAEVLKMPATRFELDTTLEAYGVDSLVVVELNRAFEKVFGKLPTSLLFEKNTVRQLAVYFLHQHGACLAQIARTSPVSLRAPAMAASSAIRPIAPKVTEPVELPALRTTTSATPPPAPSVLPQAMEIAIVGLKGRYPGARTVEEFWENLKAGRSGISEVPAERWAWQTYYAPKSRERKAGKGYGKWGGFIEGPYEFDPMFFQISPREAERMDPQERLFLQTAWEVIEDAGYTPEGLAGADHRVGVFVGVMNGNYEWQAAQAYFEGQDTGACSAFWSIANRVSYVLNFQGPSLAVDTACSSSLTAIHLACESLRRGECTAAIAGGVNLILHPVQFVRLSQLNMLSEDGRCRSFGAGADGFVDGEGVGAVLLKPLAAALADGDAIYAVIRGSAINAGGKTSGYTVPNPNAQSALVRCAMSQAGWDPASLSYVEAHGTGTSLGDPIEIAALQHVLAKARDEKQYCAIGSVKSNIGHLESAAGIAGLTKTVLQLCHRTLAPSLHAEVLNPGIAFEETAFRVQRELTAWDRPRYRKGGTWQEPPRRAGVSSFGAGGANAHLLVEEFVESRPSSIPPGQQPNAPIQTAVSTAVSRLIVLSAPNRERLREQARRLLAFLERGKSAAAPADESPCLENRDVKNLETPRDHKLKRASSPALRAPSPPLAAGERNFPGQSGQIEPLNAQRSTFNAQRPTTPGLNVERWTLDVESSLGFVQRDGVRGKFMESLAYTLQTGRVAFEDRLAVVASTEAELCHLLEQFLGGTEADGLFVRAESRSAPAMALEPEEDAEGLVRSWLEQRQLAQLAKCWVNGGRIPWRLLHAGTALRRLHLPTYPFARENYSIVRPPEPSTTQPAPNQASSSSLVGRERGPSCPPQALNSRPADRIVRAPFGARSRLGQNESCSQAAVGAESNTGSNVSPTLSGLYVPVWREWSPAKAEGAPSTPSGERSSRAANTLYVGLGADAGRIDGLRAVFGQGPVIMVANDSPAVGSGVGDTVLDVPFSEVGRRVLGDLNPARIVVLCDARVSEGPGPRNWSELKTAPLGAVRMLLALIQAAERRDGGRGSVEWIFLTTSAFPLPGDSEMDPRQSWVSGFMQSAAQEYPEWRWTLLDLEPSCWQDPANLLHRSGLERGWPRGIRALRAGVVYERTFVPVPIPEQFPRVYRHQGVYVITGGAGGLGFAVASWLVEKAAARVALIGRRAADDRIEGQLRKLRGMGGDAIYLAADIADEASLASALKEVKGRFGAIHGVFHAAGVLQDQPLRRLDETGFKAVYEVKARGSVNLAEQLQSEPLDFLVFFSSLISLTGSAGQANYAAGSAFLDALAYDLSARLPFPVRVLNWGYWGDVGLAANAATSQRLERLGFRPISAEQGNRMLEQAIALPLVQVVPVLADPQLLAGIGFDLSRPWVVDRAVLPSFLAAADVVPSFGAGDLPDQAAVGSAYARDLQRLREWSLRRLLAVFQSMAGSTGAEYSQDGSRGRSPHRPHGDSMVGRGRSPHRTDRGTGACRAVSAFMAEAGIKESFGPLVSALLDHLEQGGLLRRQETGSDEEPCWVVADSVDGLPESTLGEGSAASLGRYAQALERFLDAYPRVLTGAQDPMELLFPKGSMDLVQDVYAGNPVEESYHRKAAEIVAAYVGWRLKQDPEARIRILEVGAGTGSTTRFVLPKLVPWAAQVTYFYTDVVSAFLRHGESQFAPEHGFIRFEKLDLESEEQPTWAEGLFDLVLAANVLHATRDVGGALERLKPRVRAGGLLLVSEMTAHSELATMTFGLTPGWWRFEDEQRRLPHGPLLSRDRWLRTLRAGGWRWPTVRRLDLGPEIDPLQHSLFLGESDGQFLLPLADGLPALPAAQSAPAPVLKSADALSPDGSDSFGLKDRTIGYLKGVFSIILKLDAKRLEAETPFDQLGIDSLIAAEILGALEKDFGPLPSILMMDRITIGQLCDYFTTEKADALRRLLRLEDNGQGKSPGSAEPLRSAPSEVAVALTGGGAPLSGTSRQVRRDVQEPPAPGRLLQVGQLSDAEVDACLKDFLPG